MPLDSNLFKKGVTRPYHIVKGAIVQFTMLYSILNCNDIRFSVGLYRIIRLQSSILRLNASLNFPWRKTSWVVSGSGFFYVWFKDDSKMVCMGNRTFHVVWPLVCCAWKLEKYAITVCSILILEGVQISKYLFAWRLLLSGHYKTPRGWSGSVGCYWSSLLCIDRSTDGPGGNPQDIPTVCKGKKNNVFQEHFRRWRELWGFRMVSRNLIAGPDSHILRLYLPSDEARSKVKKNEREMKDTYGRLLSSLFSTKAERNFRLVVNS